MRRVMMISGGETSWAAAKRDALRRGVEGLTLLFCNTRDEDEDTYRFLRLAADNVGAPLVILEDGRNLWELFRDESFIGNTRADVCSRKLKREPADRWLREFCRPDETVVLLGYHVEELHRFKRAQARYAAGGWRCEAPLCEKPYLTAKEIGDWARAEGLPRQRLYELGFPHANCGGFCVKAGHAHFRHLLKMLPQVYARHEREEQAFRERTGKDVSVLRDRRGGKTLPLTMQAFRERIEAKDQCDPFDWGGCGCFGED